jgi:hypothetical protein
MSQTLGNFPPSSVFVFLNHRKRKMASSLWVQVVNEGGETIGGVFDIDPVPKHVSALRKVVKNEKKPALDYGPADELLVFPPVSEAEEKVSYTAWFSSFPDTTGNTPLVVRAPDAAPAPLESKQQGVVPARFSFPRCSPFFLLLAVLSCLLALLSCALCSLLF